MSLLLKHARNLILNSFLVKVEVEDLKADEEPEFEDPEYKNAPGSLSTSNTPDSTVQIVPSAPDSVAPGIPPNNPGNPGNPGIPVNLANPGNPGNPRNPGTPGNPSTSGNPGNPEGVEYEYYELTGGKKSKK